VYSTQDEKSGSVGSGGVRVEEQVAERPAQQVGDPSARQMVQPVVDQVASTDKSS